MKLWYILDVRNLELFDEVNLVDIGCNCYVHKNIMFDYIPYNGIDIYVYQTDDLNLIRNNKSIWTKRIPMLHVYGNTTEKGINYDWLIHGAWVEYIKEYLKKIELIVDKKNLELKILEDIEKADNEKEFKEKLKPFEIFLSR